MTKVFGFWRFIVMVGWAKSLVWETTTINGDKHAHIFSINILRRGDTSALAIMLLPVSLHIGVVKR